MAELSNEEILAAIMTNGEVVKFTPEEIAESRERYDNHEEVGRIEKRVRRERALAATQPDVYLTF